MFNPNVTAKDDRGELVREGRYLVLIPSERVYVATVYADDELTLWVSFQGVDRPQRLDELSELCEWNRVDEPPGEG